MFPTVIHNDAPSLPAGRFRKDIDRCSEELLKCDEDYMQAVCEGIERSTCKNSIYSLDVAGLSELCPIVDERVDINITYADVLCR